LNVAPFRSSSKLLSSCKTYYPRRSAFSRRSPDGAVFLSPDDGMKLALIVGVRGDRDYNKKPFPFNVDLTP